MDLRQLQMFKTVAELRGFTKAAGKLYVSHSAISRQIKLLEDELQTLLFTRSGRQVSLTDAGRALFPYAEMILQQVTQAKQAVSAVSEEQPGRLNIGTASNILTFFLLPVLEEFRRSFPKTSVLITTGYADHIIEEVRAGTVNVGVVGTPIDARALCVCPIYREEFVVVVGSRSPLARRKVLNPGELEDLPLIAYPKGSALRRVLDNLFAQLGIIPSIRLELENEEAVEKAVAGNLGASFLSRRRAYADKIRFLRIAGHMVYRDVALVHLKALPVPEHAAQFMRLCREHLKSLSHNRFIRPLPQA